VTNDRKPTGTITLRMRLDLKSEKERIMSNLQVPPEFYVSVKNSKDFQLVRQTVHG